MQVGQIRDCGDAVALGAIRRCDHGSLCRGEKKKVKKNRVSEKGGVDIKFRLNRSKTGQKSEKKKNWEGTTYNGAPTECFT